MVSEGYRALTQDELFGELNELREELEGAGLSDSAIEKRLNEQFQSWRNRGVDLSKLSAGLLAAVSGADVDTAANASANVAENNVLPLVLITIARIGIAVYTAYELYDTAKQAIAVADQIISGEGLTDEQIYNAALQLGVDVTLGYAVKKLKILEAAYNLAVRVGDKTGATRLLKAISQYRLEIDRSTLSANGFGGVKITKKGGGGAAKGSITEFVDGVTVLDRKTGTKLTGTVDLRPTIDRINSGGTFPHHNDGSVFRNKEGLLPSQPSGYYTEFVHPTPGISGPGPQRIIRGNGGELYYTPDHYSTFIPLN